MNKLFFVAFAMLFTLGINGQVKKECPNPDLAIKILRCTMNGSSITLDFVITNNTSKASGKEFRIYMGSTDKSMAYDDEGNKYDLYFR